MSKIPLNADEFTGISGLLRQLNEDQIETVGQLPKMFVWSRWMSNNTLIFGQIYNFQVNLINTNRWLNVFVVILYFENERFSPVRRITYRSLFWSRSHGWKGFNSKGEKRRYIGSFETATTELFVPRKVFNESYPSSTKRRRFNTRDDDEVYWENPPV